MVWTASLIVWTILAFSSSPTNGKPAQGETVLFLGSGVGTDGMSMVLSLPDLAPIPTDIKPHPFKKVLSDGSELDGIYATVAAVIDEKLVVCGGATAFVNTSPDFSDTSPDFSDACYTLTNGTEWSPAPSMLKKRAGAAATKIFGGLWVTGGSDDRSTEMFRHGAWYYMGALPQALSYHCLLQLNWNSFLLVGGAVREGEERNGITYILRDLGSDPEQTISGVPPIGMGCACAMLGNEAYVAGGMDPVNGHGTTKVHIFSGSEERNYDDVAWREGPELPAPIYGASLVAFDNHLYLVGGYNMEEHGGNKIIYKLDSGSWTAVASSRDDFWRYSFPALVVPKHIIQ